MDIETIRRLYDYTYWAHRRVWDCALTLSEDDFRRDMGYAWDSVHGQLVHTMSAEWIWFERLRGRTPSAMFTPADYPDRSSIRARWDEIEADIRAYLDTLTDADLQKSFTYARTGGQQYQEVTGFILLHVANHGTDHRAQVLTMLHRLGAPTVEQDLIYYLRERGLNSGD